jgi:hypothetical protein
MRLAVRIFVSIAAGLLICAGLAELIIYSANVKTRRKSELLLNSVRHLKLGEELQDVQPILIRYGARTTSGMAGSMPERIYSIRIANDIVNVIGFKCPALWRVGLKPSGVVVNLIYTQEKLSSLSYSFSTFLPEASPLAEELSATVQLKERGTYQANRNYRIGVGRGSGPSTFGVGAIVTPEANDEEHDAAFDFDLSCLSRFGGCQMPCELMPAVWKDALRRYENKEISLPREVLDNPRCSPPDATPPETAR